MRWLSLPVIISWQSLKVVGFFTLLPSTMNGWLTRNEVTIKNNWMIDLHIRHLLMRCLTRKPCFSWCTDLSCFFFRERCQPNVFIFLTLQPCSASHWLLPARDQKTLKPIRGTAKISVLLHCHYGISRLWSQAALSSRGMKSSAQLESSGETLGQCWIASIFSFSHW